MSGAMGAMSRIRGRLTFEKGHTCEGIDDAGYRSRCVEYFNQSMIVLYIFIRPLTSLGLLL